MHVKFSYNQIDKSNQSKERTLEVQSNMSELDIQSMFSFVLGIPYNQEECEYKIITDEEMFAYTE